MSHTERRSNFQLTTTGVGHAYRPPIRFPAKNITPKIFQPLPRKLTVPCQITINDVYCTTSEEAFCSDHNDQPSTVPQQYKKAPSHLKVNYTLDTSNKLDKKPWRIALTTGNQTSETHDKFAAKSESISCQPKYALVHQTLQDHFNNGVTKNLKPTNAIPELQGKPVQPQEQAILERLEPYMTTNHWYHREFSSQELKKYPKKNISTFWQCEEYPKAWGFGMTTNPLTKREKKADPQTMRDRMVFKQSTNTLITRPYKQHTPLSRWLNSLSSIDYAHPSHSNKFKCPVKFNEISKDESLLRTVPKMYESNNMTYGSDNN